MTSFDKTINQFINCKNNLMLLLILNHLASNKTSVIDVTQLINTFWKFPKEVKLLWQIIEKFNIVSSIFNVLFLNKPFFQIFTSSSQEL